MLDFEGASLFCLESKLREIGFCIVPTFFPSRLSLACCFASFKSVPMGAGFSFVAKPVQTRKICNEVMWFVKIIIKSRALTQYAMRPIWGRKRGTAYFRNSKNARKGVKTWNFTDGRKIIDEKFISALSYRNQNKRNPHGPWRWT